MSVCLGVYLGILRRKRIGRLKAVREVRKGGFVTPRDRGRGAFKWSTTNQGTAEED